MEKLQSRESSAEPAHLEDDSVFSAAVVTSPKVAAAARQDSSREEHFAEKRKTLDNNRPPFSKEAAIEWNQRVAEYKFDLAELALLEASREGDNVVSDHHVERAAQFLVTRRSDRTAALLKDVGGITMGTGAGSLLAFASAGIYGSWLALAVLFTVVGTGIFFRYSR